MPVDSVNWCGYGEGMNETIIASNPLERRDIIGAFDITITIGEVVGEVTIQPDSINGGWKVFGDTLDMWMSDDLNDWTCGGSEDDRRARIDAIASSAIELML